MKFSAFYNAFDDEGISVSASLKSIRWTYWDCFMRSRHSIKIVAGMAFCSDCGAFVSKRDAQWSLEEELQADGPRV